MTDYTPTTETVRERFADGFPRAGYIQALEDFDRWLAAHDAEVRAAEMDALRSTISEAQARFRHYASQEAPTYDQEVDALLDISRILSSAEVRAGVVAEEPEWEYSWAGTDDEGDDWVMDDAFDTRGAAVAYVTRTIGRWVNTDNGTLVRRRKAGPWVPVDEDGADQ